MKININDQYLPKANTNLISPNACFLDCTYHFKDEKKKDDGDCDGYDDDEKKCTKPLTYSEEMTIRGISSINKLSYKVIVKNPKVLGCNPVLLQNINKEIEYDALDDSFCKNLKITSDNKFIKLINIQGCFGEVDVSKTNKGFRIESQSPKPTIMANCELTHGKYYYEIEIVRLSNVDNMDLSEIMNSQQCLEMAGELGLPPSTVAQQYVSRYMLVLKIGFATLEHGPTEARGILFTFFVFGVLLIINLFIW